ncbi:MAG: M20/M25/M40 family metallo-hydrolase [Chloroflexi bacterium]|nr:MAG: M20/M25/M40 family metallo-hydrolase [Chloroflexota bacterium]
MALSIQQLAASLAPVRAGLDLSSIVQSAITIQQIPAPTFAEKQRAEFIRDSFVRLGLQDVELDDVYNVYGRWPGTDPDRPAVLVSAHTDTVFPQDADLAVRHEGEQVCGPGIGDNSLGVAGLLTLLKALHTHDLHPTADLWLAANSREEGLGDLGGIRAIWQKLGPRLGAAVIIEGMALGRIYHAGIAVRRRRIVCQSPGGHSWLHFGRPSAIHGLIELGAQIIGIRPPEQPRTTYNIGLIEGGHSVNSLATSAALYLDLRSETPDGLAALEQQVYRMIEALNRPGYEYTSTIVGDRPAGSISTEHPLVQMAAAAMDVIGYKPTYETGSTDANVLLANGLPTVTVGVTHGSNAHRLDEYVETGPVVDGVWHIILLALAAAGWKSGQD